MHAKACLGTAIHKHVGHAYRPENAHQSGGRTTPPTCSTAKGSCKRFRFYQKINGQEGYPQVWVLTRVAPSCGVP